MKSDNEIKEWIDSREVMTMRELAAFLYGKGNRSTGNPRFLLWWGYVLQTKNLTDLKLHRERKIITQGGWGMVSPERVQRAREIILSDPRLLASGYKRGLRILENVYGIKMSITTYKKIKRQSNELV